MDADESKFAGFLPYLFGKGMVLFLFEDLLLIILALDKFPCRLLNILLFLGQFKVHRAPLTVRLEWWKVGMME